MIRYKQLPIIISFKLSKNYALDLTLFNKIGSYKDWMGFFQMECSSHYYKADHNPCFNMHFMILSVNIFELDIYNVNHVDDSSFCDCKEEKTSDDMKDFWEHPEDMK